MIKMLVVTFALSMTVSTLAKAAEASRTESKRVSTGREFPIRFSTSRCSMPPLSPLFDKSQTFAFVSSNFEYKVCREYSTSDYTVTGSFWNKSAKEISGTARISYQIEEATRGSSQTVTGEKDRGINPFTYTSAVTSVTLACENMRQLVSNQEVDLTQTPCH